MVGRRCRAALVRAKRQLRPTEIVHRGFCEAANHEVKLIWSSLRFYARSHLGTLLGVTVAGAILVGALAIGDCVRESLRDLALARIGRTTFVLAAADRFFRSALADDLQPAAAVLQLPGTAATPDDAARANHVQILGVDEHFWALAQTPVSQQIPPVPSLLNTALAEAIARQGGRHDHSPRAKAFAALAGSADLAARRCFDGPAADRQRGGDGRAVWTVRFAGQPGLAAQRLSAALLVAGKSRSAGPRQSAPDQRTEAGLETTLDPCRRRPGMARRAGRIGIAQWTGFH
jgi:hypothetical protein